MLSRLANPHRFMRTSSWLMPTLGIVGLLMIASGTYWALWQAPAEKYQGDSARIMFIHVPAAWLSMGGYIAMAAAGFTWLVWRHALADVAARAIAPLGAAFTAICLATGSIWGKPTWGTWWEWDPRLTSFLVLFLFYLGYMALWEAVDNPDAAADLTSVLCLVGSVFAVISRYALVFWNQGLHQGATLSLDAEQNIADVFWYPLITALAGFGFLFLALVLYRTRTEIRARRLKALIAQERMA